MSENIAPHMQSQFVLSCAVLSVIIAGCGESSSAKLERLIPDDNLRIAIRRALDAQNQTEGPVTVESLAKLQELKASESSIQSLQGIELCTELVVLDLRQQGYFDYGDVSGPAPCLENLSGLTKLSRLRDLDLSSNFLEGSLDLSGLSCLETVNLRDNALSGVVGLGQAASLRSLDISDNCIVEFAWLKDLLNVEDLAAQGYPWTDIQLQNISAMKALKRLDLGRLQLSLPCATLSSQGMHGGVAQSQSFDISFASGLSNLEVLKLHGAALSGKLPIENLPKLQYVDLRDTSIKHVDIPAGSQVVVLVGDWLGPVS